MKIISHRGNINGSNIDQENKLEYIENAIQEGFDVEIDIWVVNNKIFLGHDLPQNEIEIEYLFKNKTKLWIHCKNLDALYFFGSFEDFNYFWHEKDKFTLTSKNFIWTYPQQNLTKNSIIVDLLGNKKYNNIYGICTDYPINYI